jgi:hypothetical protein
MAAVIVSVMARLGPHPFNPTATQSKLVFDLKVSGWSDEKIAKALGITRPTLRLRCGQALQAARGRREASVSDEERLIALRALHKAAKGGRVSAIIMLLKLMDRAQARQERR